MKKMRFLIPVLLIFAMAMAFAGCGSGGDEDTCDIPEPEAGGSAAFSFETEDLEGNAVKSADLFAEQKVTMLNVWGTFCGPCIEEMPELEKINQEYADRGVAIVGLVCDVSKEDDSLLQDAFDIIDDTGVTYRNLYWTADLEEQAGVSAVPTTFFVDQEGNMLGDPVVGADPDMYRATLDLYLSEEE